MVLARHRGRFAAAAVVAAAAATMTPPAHAESPAAGRPVEDRYAGTTGPHTVVDDYRWLENLDDPAVKDWVALQNAATRRVLDGLPSHAAIRGELKEVVGRAPTTRYALRHAGGRLFALKRQPPANQPVLVVFDAAPVTSGALDDEPVVLDPNQRNDKGTTAIDWFVPSHDGRLVAVSLSDNGSERGSLHFFETATGRELADVIPRVQNPTAGGSVAWNGDDTGVWFTRYPAPMERPPEDAAFYQQVWFHTLGTRSAYDHQSLADGLGMSLSSAIELDADTFAFLFDSLGVPTTASVAAPSPQTGPGLPETR